MEVEKVKVLGVAATVLDMPTLQKMGIGFAKSVCRHAVKANDPLRYLEIEKLIQDLLQLRSAVSLSPRPPDHDPDFARGTGKEVWAKSLGQCVQHARVRSF
jgi:hypothetical protein